MAENEFERVFGRDNLESFTKQNATLFEQKKLETELDELNDQLKSVWRTDLSRTDVIVSISFGVLMGLFNALFKQYIPKHGKFKHDHNVNRTAIDSKVPKPMNMKGSVQNLHRQIGPQHDIFRFKEALELISGERNDFPLWGRNISDFTDGILHPGNMKIDEFLSRGGFRIPADPCKELMNHLLIDFFTKMSLPIPGSTYIADHNQTCAKIMMTIYDDGLNLKNFIGNLSSTMLLEFLNRGYAFLFKALPYGIDCFNTDNSNKFISAFKEIKIKNKEYLQSNEFNLQGMIAHGSSFLIDTIISTSSKSYAGLFQLNLGSLTLFSTYTIKYLIKCLKESNEIKSNISEVHLLLSQAENDWYSRFRNNILDIANDNNFITTFSPQIIIERNHSTSIAYEEITETVNRRKELLYELDGVDIK